MSRPDLSRRREWRAGAGAFADDVLAGLSASPKRLPAKYFYDERGSALFERICELPEYYPTRTELKLLRRHAGEIADLMGRDVTLVEFGAGALKKVELLLDALRFPRAYVPVDISSDFLHTMATELRRRKPHLNVHPVAADFTRLFAFPVIGDGERRVGFFPGSTIGNLQPADAVAFLRHAVGVLRGGGMLIGVDLVKDPAVLHAAYNDHAGVTEAFNKNMLERANRELGADFDSDAFAHYAFYEPLKRRVEMHLVSRVPQTVRILDRRFQFVEGESIHTENSHKYTPEDFSSLAKEAGFIPEEVWMDAERLFSLHWLSAAAG